MNNAVYPARRLTEADAAQVCALMQGNPLFYRYHPPQPTPEIVRADMTALPPGKAPADKWFVGFYDGGCMARLSAAGYHRLRLAVDEGNPQSLAFWTKNGFALTGEVRPNDFSAYLPMERSI